MTSGAGPQRVFFALWPDEAARGQLTELARELAYAGGRPVRSANLHMTLAFIGAAGPEQVEALATAAATVAAPSCELRLDKLGYWPHGGVVWAGCHEVPSRLRRLYEQLMETLVKAGMTPDHRPWVPHVTLVRHGRAERLPSMPEPVQWTSQSFSLVASELHPSGARYRVLQEWPLHG